MGVQKAMADPEREPTVRLLYETMGVYLGYALAQYSEFYTIDHVMVLGRVSKDKGGDVMFEKAREVLNTEFPDLKIELHSADDHFKRWANASPPQPCQFFLQVMVRESDELSNLVNRNADLNSISRMYSQD